MRGQAHDQAPPCIFSSKMHRCMLLLAALAGASHGASPRVATGGNKTLGCYWYPREAAAPVTNRTLASIPPQTCQYVDIAGARPATADAPNPLPPRTHTHKHTHKHTHSNSPPMPPPPNTHT